MESILELRELSKHYPAHRAVDGISLSVEPGAFYSLLGPSGCGKTTTLRLIAGFDSPTSGDIRLNGQSILSLRPYQRPVNTVFQNYALFPHLSVRDNIAFGLVQQRKLQEGAVSRVLDLVQLAGKESRMPSELSGGERQRVALARSLVLEPEVLLLDEPLSALDPGLRKEVRTELKALQRRTGITFVFITHDQEEALSLSDRIAVMHQGKVEQTGTPREIYLTPATRFVAGFLGAVNWIDGCGIRPESTRLARVKPSDVRSLDARVDSTTFLGHCIQVRAFTTEGASIVAELSRSSADSFAPGDPVHIWWHPADEMSFP
jgi:ABC-type Fe3+/spermidine/putrescine transport system ATPase subunit